MSRISRVNKSPIKKIIYCFLFVLISYAEIVFAQSSGETLFSQKCSSCHTIGNGKRVGPDLANVDQRRDTDWLVSFIQSSQSMIASGDSVANALFIRNNKIVMPDHRQLTKNDILSIIDYIKINSPDPGNPGKKTPKQIFDATQITKLDYEKGKKLFEGTASFKNGGTPCIACHNVSSPGVFPGGNLAKDLTTAFTRLGPAGIDGIVKNPPFQPMIDSFGNRPLTNQEVKSLLAFLYYSANGSRSQNYVASNNMFFIIIIIAGLNVVFVLLLFNWRRVKKYSVSNFR
jgi:cytochrome c2